MAQATPGHMVLEFHDSFGLPSSTSPTLDVASDLIAFRTELLREELHELADALDARDLIGVADALADVVYVIYGTALTFGIDLDSVVAEVHRSNMSKLGRDGRPVMRPDGKVLKGPDYSPPDVSRALGLPGIPLALPI